MPYPILHVNTSRRIALLLWRVLVKQTSIARAPVAGWAQQSGRSSCAGAIGRVGYRMKTPRRPFCYCFSFLLFTINHAIANDIFYLLAGCRSFFSVCRHHEQTFHRNAGRGAAAFVCGGAEVDHAAASSFIASLSF